MPTDLSPTARALRVLEIPAFRVDGGQELRIAVATLAARFAAALVDQP